MSTTPQDPSAAPVISCAEAEKLTRAFTAGELGKDRQRQLRSHLAKCRECMDSYRQSVETTASLSRFTLEDREKKQVERAKRNLHAKVFGANKPKPRRFPFRLRLILMPAFVIYLMMQVTQLGPPPARVELVGVSGLVMLSNKPVNPETENLLVLPGRWLRTQALAKASLDSGECRFELGGDTELLLEDARPLRMRLRRGYLTVDGDITIVTVIGMVKVTQGQGSLHLSGAGLRVQPTSGSWSFLDRHGERPLPTGDGVLLRP